MGKLEGGKANMTRNPILEELYAARDEILAEYDGDLRAYIEGARQRTLASGHPISVRESQALRRKEPAKPGDSASGAVLATPAEGLY